MSFRHRLILSINNFVCNREWVSSGKRLSESHKLIDHAPKRPDISFFRVGLRAHNFGAAIQNGPNETFHHRGALCSPPFRKSKIG